MMAYRINLDLSPKRPVKGNTQLFLNWTEASGRMEPAMVFRKSGGLTIYVLPLSVLHSIVGSSGFGLAAIVSQAAEIAEAIGFSRMDRAAARDVADLILDWSEDLIRMPPDPPPLYIAEHAKRGPTAELSLSIDGQTVMDTEIAA